jgi:hypothetical protein
MSTEMSTNQGRIRLVFELERADNPRLYDELIKFNKGQKRVNRLRTLAQEGLLAQLLPLKAEVRIGEIERNAGTAKTESSSIFNQIFDAPIME